MKRTILLLLAFAALGVVNAAPVRMPRVPEKLPDPPPQLVLRGTTWSGSCFDIPCVITFEPNGSLTYRVNKDDQNISPGNWRLTGNQLVFEINQYSEHRGPVLGNAVQGESSNKGGMRGKFQLQRVSPGQ